jgi:hypothetical protein
MLRGAKNGRGGNRLDSVLNDVTQNARLFVFMIGGLSHNEIVNIANLQNEIPAQIIPGSNEIITVDDFLD